jgi:long-chain fatty acid transport protein
MTRRVLCAAAVAAAALPASARAGGLFVPGYGPQAQPRAGAFVAKADDASALYYNPAGLAWQKGTSLSLGMNFIDFQQRYQRSGSYETPEDGDPLPWTGQPFEEVNDASTPAVGFGGFQGIPLIGVVTDLGGRIPLPMVFGIGMIADHGFPEREYQEDYVPDDPDSPPPPQRYDIIEQDVSAAFPSIAAAYAITEKLAVGARFSWGFGGSKSTQFLWALRNYPEDARTDGRFAVDLKDNFVPAAAIGVHFRATPNIELGANYNTVKHINFKGDGQAVLGPQVGLGDMRDFIAPETDFPLCEGGGTIAALKTCVNLDLPQNATVGGRYVFRDPDGRERGDVEFDVQWEDWSASSDIEVIVDGKSGLTGLRLQPVNVRHGFKDTYSFRLGGGWGFDIGDNRLIARAGAAYDTAAAPLTWTRLDVDGMARTTLGTGLGFETGPWRFDLGGGVVLESKRTVPGCNPDVDNLGCPDPAAGGDQTPQDDRDFPDPIQPLGDTNNQVESPFNAGTYEQGYILLSLGVTYMF